MNAETAKETAAPAGKVQKKILILADWYEPGYLAGGPIQSVRNFVAALCERYELFVITGDRDLGDGIPYSGIETEKWIVRTPSVKVFYTARLTGFLLGQLLKQTDPDFIYLNSLYSFRYSIVPLLLLWQGKLRAKVILSPRGMLRASAVAHKSKKKKPFLAFLRLLGIPGKIAFHATDEQEKKDIRFHFPKAGPVTLIPNFSPAPDPHTFPLAKTSGELHCVFIGRIMDIKNLAFFTGLLPQLPENIRLIFSIYGSVENEPYWEAIREKIGGFSSNIRVTYHGPVPHAEVRGVLDKHHLFILPTRGENFGHAIFEAFAAGRPVLISDKTPWRELQNKKAGWDLPIDQPTAWLEALVTAAGWNQDAFEQASVAALAVATDYQAGTDLTAAYQQLFS